MHLDKHFLKTVLAQVELVGKTAEDIVFATDLSSVRSGYYYVVQSPNNDRATVIKEALKRDAFGFLIARQEKEFFTKWAPNSSLIVVDNVKGALKKLATAWRSNFSYPVIGITGSIGKSCTKKVLSNILHAQGIEHLVAFSGNNTLEDLAIDVLRMRPLHEVALFEMGVTKRGTMAELADIVKPSYAVITNVGHSHMDDLGSLLDIAIEKKDIFKNFTQESIGIVNGDIPILGNIAYVHPVIKFGAKTINQVQARKIHMSGTRISFILKLYKKKYPVLLEGTHEGTVFNALAATAVAHLLDIPADVIVKGIQEPLIIPGRFEHRQLTSGRGMLINDCSGANPESMKTALLAFQNLDTKGQKIAVLGDMNGLGVNSPFWHRQIGRFLRKVPSIKHLILVGDLVKWVRKTLPVRISADLVPTWKDAAEKLQEKLNEESVILVKGSDPHLQHLVDLFSEQTIEQY